MNLKRILRGMRPGLGAGEAVTYGLIALILILSGYAILRSVQVQQRVSKTFIGWNEDKAGYDKALAEQKSSGKPMLVYIYAPWCPHCKRFTADVLSDPEMVDFVKQYPRVRVSPENGPGERKIMDDYGATGFPSFYVTMPGGKRTKVETVSYKPKPHLRNTDEFIQAINDTIAGKPPEKAPEEATQTYPAAGGAGHP